MTKREAAIISLYTGFLIGSFSDMHAYAEEVMGSPIFTHQFANKDLVEKMKEKCKPEFMLINKNLKEDVEPETHPPTSNTSSASLQPAAH